MEQNGWTAVYPRRTAQPLVGSSLHQHRDGLRSCDLPSAMISIRSTRKFLSSNQPHTMSITRSSCKYRYLITATASYAVPNMDCSWKDYYPESQRNVITTCRWQADLRKNKTMEIKSLSDITWGPMPPGYNTRFWDGRLPSVSPWVEPGK